MVSMGAVANRLAELESVSPDSTQTAQDRKAIQDMIAHYKREGSRLDAERLRLATEEADAAQALAMDQSRWSALNGQVEALERVLMQRR
jgi:septal ring factor EnvC (AmiA/AmiB activator)